MNHWITKHLECACERCHERPDEVHVVTIAGSKRMYCKGCCPACEERKV